MENLTKHNVKVRVGEGVVKDNFVWVQGILKFLTFNIRSFDFL